LSRVKRQARADRFEAVQAAAIELLKDHEGPYQEGARIVWHQLFESSLRFPHATEAPEIGNWLELPTFFTELRERQALRSRLWPDSDNRDPIQAFRERELRAQLLASAARLGHAFIDLYIMTIRRLDSLNLRAQESSEDDSSDLDSERIIEFLDLIETQMCVPREDRGWGAFDELADISENFDLLLDVNEPEARLKPLAETARIFGRLLRKQQPVGGMSGKINQTLVRQFRMPGYPLVLVTTDLLQEGEDLHTFCSEVHHYGIAWTPSSMEQRVGRVDRVRSHTERRLVNIEGRSPFDTELLQVYFPHLEDTVEVLQVQRVLERINLFLRLMHEGLTTAGGDERSIDAGKEFVRGRRHVPQIRERLKSAFPVTPEQVKGEDRDLAVGPDVARHINDQFTRIEKAELPDLDIVWEPPVEPGMLLGTVRLGSRVQPFSLLLRSFGAHPAVRCISPVGCVVPGAGQDVVVSSAAVLPIRIGAVVTREERTYDLTTEGDVLLAESAETDALRVAALIKRVTQQADALEQEHLPGRDEVLATFRGELSQEGSHGR